LLPSLLLLLLVGMWVATVVVVAVGETKTKNDNTLSTPFDTIEWLARILLVEYIGMLRRNRVKSPWNYWK
jgi:hypothetical protein